MNISITETKLLELITEGLKHTNVDGFSFKNLKVTEFKRSSTWGDENQYMLTVENDHPHW